MACGVRLSARLSRGSLPANRSPLRAPDQPLTWRCCIAPQLLLAPGPHMRPPRPTSLLYQRWAASHCHSLYGGP